MTALRSTMEIVRIQWNAFKNVTLYESLSIGEFLLGVFIIGAIVAFMNMFMHRGE